MSVSMVETWVVKPEYDIEHKQLWKEFLEYMRKNPELFKEIKSMNLYSQTFGNVSGAIVQVVEFESWAEKENLDKRLKNSTECIKFHEELMQMKVVGSISMGAWETYI
ncbi:MAG: hypothetical protein GKC03_04275 [Methanomassiliicoccales archaeon]|nr:hypothetical protein [Methanomassiliicoccales archaeon]NYT15901.1 hypothetical protein [Methanomassiliicoccales archaeon]